MSAQRKLTDSAAIAPRDDAAPVEHVTSVDYETPPLAGDLPISPAILLQEQLAARIAEANAGTAATPDVAEVRGAKWPMALRIVTILALSLTLWGGIFLATVAVLT